MGFPKISDIHFQPIRPREGLIGFVQFKLNDAFSVAGIGVHTRLDQEGIRLLYPTKRLHDGTVFNLFYPITKSVGESIENVVWDKLKAIVGKTLLLEVRR